jgi:hypothetical protein
MTKLQSRANRRWLYLAIAWDLILVASVVGLTLSKGCDRARVPHVSQSSPLPDISSDVTRYWH